MTFFRGHTSQSALTKRFLIENHFLTHDQIYSLQDWLVLEFAIC